MDKVKDLPESFWERAARIYCEMRGIDPDERQRVQGDGAAVAVSAPRWRKVALEMKHLGYMIEAIEQADRERDAEIEAASWSPWFDWHGGECPIADGQEINVQFAAGDECGGRQQPSGLYWKLDTIRDGDRIIRYRVHWTAHDGLPICPVDPMTPVVVKLRDGGVSPATLAGNWQWGDVERYFVATASELPA